MTTIVYTGTREPEAVPGVELVHLPMLARLPLTLPRDLSAQLQNPAHERRHAVFYSRNAAEFALEAVQPGDLADVRVWAVGEQTAAWLESKLDVEVRRPAREDFVGLLAALKEEVTPEDLVVSFELEGTERPLNEMGLGCHVVSIATYETVPTNWDDLDGLLRRVSPRWVVFASPRAYRVFRNNLHHRVVGDSYKVAAIGASTKEAIEQAGDRVDFVPKRPDLSALLAELSGG